MLNIRCEVRLASDMPCITLVIDTTAAWSRTHLMVRPFQLCPHSAHDITMGSSSLEVMWIAAQAIGHRNWNHAPREVYAPLLNALDSKVASGFALSGIEIILTLFQ